MKKVFLIFISFVLTSCASNSYMNSNTFKFYKKEYDKSVDILGNLEIQKNECKNLSETMKRRCINEYDVKISSAQKTVDKQRNLMIDYITSNHNSTSKDSCSRNIFNPCDDVRWVSDNIYYRKDGTKIVIVDNTRYLENGKMIKILSKDEEKKALESASKQLEQLAIYNSKKNTPKKITKRNSTKKNDNSDIWFALLTLLNDSWNPKKPQIDKGLMDELSSDLFKDYYSIPDKSLPSVPITTYKLGSSALNEFIIQDLITKKAYKGRWNLSGEEVLFDNGMTGRFDSNGNFIFSNF